MAHREGIRDYLKDVNVGSTVIDWGCGTKPIMKYLKDADKIMFTNVDKEQFGQVDKIEDIEVQVNLPFKEYETAFCLEVLEHTWHPAVVIENIYAHLGNGGVLYLSHPFMYKVHKEDDRIRFTHHGLKQLLEEAGFTVEDIQPTVGDLDHAEGYIVRARK